MSNVLLVCDLFNLGKLGMEATLVTYRDQFGEVVSDRWMIFKHFIT